MKSILLGEALNFYNGKTVKAGKYGSFPVYGSNGIIGYVDKHKFEESIIIGRVGAYCGSINYEKGKYWASDNTIVADAKGDYSTLYFSYLLKIFPLNSLAGGSAQPLINQTILSRVKTRVPDFKTQKKIAAILSGYDDLIENNKRRIALLEKMAEEIYREWFVRFRFPGYKKAEFDKGIPRGWSVKKLGEISDITSSKRIFLSDYVESGVPFYRSKEIIERYFGEEPSTPLYISEDKFIQIKDKFGFPKENDILITSVGTLGIPCLVRKNDRFYFKDGNLIWFKSLNHIHNKFLYFWMQTPLGKGRLLETTIGSSQPAFTITGLKQVEIIMPNDEILSEFMGVWDSMRSQKEILIQSVKCLKTTRDKLLPRLISGKLSVENLDIQFPPSMLND